MAAGLQILSQLNWFAGAHPGMEFVPDGSRRYHYQGGAEDIVNGLISDDGAVYRRGGTVQTAVLTSGSGAAAKPCALTWVGYLPGRPTMLIIDRTWVASGSNAYWNIRALDATTGTTELKVHAASDVLSLAGTLVAASNWLQPVEVTGALFIASGLDTTVRLYGGAPNSTIGAVTLNVTAGSPVATMTSTAGVAAGHMIENAFTNGPVGEVQTVDSGTQITLEADQPSTAAVTVNFRPVLTLDLTTYQPQLLKGAIDAIGSAAHRLYVAQRNRIFFSNRKLTLTWTKDDYHELPFGSRILGLAGLGNTMLVFSTAGVWAIGNAELALTDPAGNVQQTLNLIDPEFVLWDHHGIAAWQGRLIVPGTQDVMMVAEGGAMSAITGGVASLYRGYVKAGCSTGTAAVYRGSYMLPIIDADGVTVVDVLVCRLESGAWTRWSGQAAAAAFGVYTGAVPASRAPLIRAVKANVALDVSGCFDVSTAHTTDADGVAHALVLTWRTLSLGGTTSHTWRLFRAGYDLDGTGGLSLETAVGPPGSAFTSQAGIAAAGSEALQTWTFARQGRNFRVRLTSSGAPSKLVVRSGDAGVRPHQQV